MQLYQGFKLGTVLVRPVEGLLVGEQGSVPVHPHAMEVLLFMARQPGSLLTRGQIMRAVWGSNPVAQDTLTKNIAELRHALGDDPQHPMFIQTVPRRGYRLVATVTPLGVPSPAQLTDSTVGPFKRWWNELSRRRVFKVMTAYTIIAWGVVQTADILTPIIFDQPTWIMTMLLVMVVMGAPVALAMAWVLQITPEGIGVDTAGTRLKKSISNPVLMSVGIVAALLVGFVTYSLVMPPFVDGRVRIAVLPLVNIGAEENQVFCDGLTEDLTYILGRIPELKVAPQKATDLFRHASLQDADVALRLNVTHLVEGSCRYDGEQIRVTAQLIEAEKGLSNWSQAYSVSPSNIFQIQEDIARKVARSLHLVLSSGTDKKLDAEPTQSGEAYAAYLRARGFLRRARTEQNLTSAELQFREASNLDPGYGDAYAGLCETYLAWYELQREVGRYEEAERACVQALVKSRGSVEVNHALGELYRYAGQYERALDTFKLVTKLDPTFADGYVGQARVLAELNQPDKSEVEFKKAIEEDPVYWVSINAYGAFLMKRGRYAEAAEEFFKVTLLDPTSSLAFNNLGAANVMAGNFKQAGEAFERSNALEPDAAAMFNTGNMYFYAGDFEGAQKFYRQAIELNPDDYRLWGGLGDALQALAAGEAASAAYVRASDLASLALAVNPEDQLTRAAHAHYMARTGRFAEAEEAIDIATTASPDDMDIRYYEALVRIEQGRVDRALVAIGAALEAGYPPGLLAADPGFKTLRSDPRFKSLLGRP
ncbi:MAG: tetratricopeptide repeat protein [Gammaproteobacteria bacterium]|nr:tetratricopeptide repeat protein [Gammaproteobacteria bacterium]